MRRTVIGLFQDFEDLKDAIKKWEESDLTRDYISVVTREEKVQDRLGGDPVDLTVESAGAGAIAGAIVGGGVGILAGVTLLPLPGIGPALASGSVVAAIGVAAAGAGVGAASGGFMGALIGLGMSEEEAHRYVESVKRGETLVAIETEGGQVSQVVEAMEQADARDVEVHPGTWESAEPEVSEAVEADAATEVVEMLNRLLVFCRDNREGLRIAVKNLKDDERVWRFEKYARQYARFASTLEKTVQKLGGDPTSKGGVAAALHRGWVNLKAAITIREQNTLDVLLEAVQESTDETLSVYRGALERDLPDGVRSLLEDQLVRIEQIQNRLGELEQGEGATS